MNEELQELQKEIARLRELDEFNENMYKQRFIQLKKSFTTRHLRYFFKQLTKKCTTVGLRAI